jgi:hypothetical protein
MGKTSRRGFMAMLAAGAILAPGLLIPRRTFFLPPIGGWGAHPLASLMIPSEVTPLWAEELAAGRVTYDAQTQIMSLWERTSGSEAYTQVYFDRTLGKYVDRGPLADLINDGHGEWHGKGTYGTLIRRYEPDPMDPSYWGLDERGAVVYVGDVHKQELAQQLGGARHPQEGFVVSEPEFAGQIFRDKYGPYGNPVPSQQAPIRSTPDADSLRRAELRVAELESKWATPPDPATVVRNAKRQAEWRRRWEEDDRLAKERYLREPIAI